MKTVRPFVIMKETSTRWNGRDKEGNPMRIRAILLQPVDKVVTVVDDVHAGDTVFYQKEGQEVEVEAREEVPAFHKVAVVDLKDGEEVIKYGQVIGAMMSDAKKGDWISHKNVRSLPRNYDEEC